MSAFSQLPHNDNGIRKTPEYGRIVLGVLALVLFVAYELLRSAN